MKVGILGSGVVGRAIGTGLVETGHTVKIGTRHPEDAELVAWRGASGDNASVGSFAEAAEFGEIVVVSTLGSATLDVLRIAGPAHFQGKVVIDTTNPLEFPPNAPPALFVGHTDSLGERVQRALPGARVVKAFNTAGNTTFFRPKLPGGPPDMMIAGDDAAAKATVAEILRDFGWGTVDLGGIDGARQLEQICLAWVRAAMGLGTWEIAFKVLRK